MQIGFLQAYFSRGSVGGGELHTEHLARALMAHGHEVTIFTDEPNDRRTGIDDLDVREYPTPVKINPITELALAQKAFDDMQACDILVLTDDSAWRGVDLPIPTVMVFHIVWHGWIDRHKPLSQILLAKPQALVYRQMEKKICRDADAIVSISPNVREDILMVGDVAEKIVDIPNGVDVNRFTPTDEKYDEFTVYFQGRLVQMKNPGLLIEAARIADRDWRLVIGGDGPLRDDLETHVADYDLTGRVEFLGYVPSEELQERYGRSHLFALPSDYEGMPLTVLEAAACGTAVLASPRAATEFVTEEMGRVVDPTPEQLVSVIDDLATKPDEVTEMGRAARNRVERYSWDEIAEKYELLFEQIIH